MRWTIGLVALASLVIVDVVMFDWRYSQMVEYRVMQLVGAIRATIGR